MHPEKTKTKIVCTIGPATSTKHMLARLVYAGMNVARLNFSHGQMSDHVSQIRVIREVSRTLKVPIGILVDLPGPKIRIGKISPDPVMLKDGSQIVLTARHVIGDQSIVSVSHSSVLKELE